MTVMLSAWTSIVGAAEMPALSGPNKQIAARIEVNADGRLALILRRSGVEQLRASALGITVDGQDLGLGVEVGAPGRREIFEKYACRGVKSEAVNHCIAYEVPLTHKPSGLGWTLEIRVFDDGVAWRYRVPGAGRRRIGGEATTWQLPPQSAVWVQSNTANYEGAYQRYRADQIPLRTEKAKLFIGCPLTVELPQGGYALLSEASLYRYSGMTLRPLGEARLQAAFEDDPQGWENEGPILSPWRLAILASDLDALVNSDLIGNLGEKPDPALFPQGVNTSWIRPGKGLITWAVFFNDGAQWHRQKWFVDMCAAMNCEYLLVDGGWLTEKWGFMKGGADPWARLKELCEYGAQKNVGIFIWHAYPEGRDDSPGLTRRQARQELFRRCKEAGVKGVKIDFFDSERKEVVEVYEDILRQTAEHQLMVNFHGANKPTGEVRTWPHEITREGIREQEYLLWDKLPLEHYGALPFTRLVAGHGDFLPCYVRPKFLKNTTAVFQLGTAIVYVSPFICWPDHPEAYLESPFLDLIRTMPPAWDETRVLEGSAIGRCVAMARRSGSDWYVAVLNCQDEVANYELKLWFLGDGDYQAALYHDGTEGRSSLRIEAGATVQKGRTLPVRLQGGGGFVAKFAKAKQYTK